MSDLGFRILVSVGAIMVAMVIYMMTQRIVEGDRAYQACIADGVKQYECFGLIYGRNRR